MNERTNVYVSETIEAILVGGPPDLPADTCRFQTGRDVSTIKVAYYGGYEHFERADDTVADGAPVVYLWTGRTMIAE